MRVEIEVGKQLIMSTFTAEKHETREWWNVFLKVFVYMGGEFIMDPEIWEE